MFSKEIAEKYLIVFGNEFLELLGYESNNSWVNNF